MTSYSTVPSPPSVALSVTPVWQRLLVTLAVVCIYRLGCHIPLPGVDPAALASLARFGRISALTAEHVSIFALGVIPIFSALMVVEFLKLIVPTFARWAARDRYNAGRVNRGVRYIALLLAAFQALGMARALPNISGLVPEADWTFPLTTVVTFVAATALLGWLGDQITRHGFGNGFWILLLTPALLHLPQTAMNTITHLQSQDVRPVELIVALGFIVLMIALLATLAIARYRAEANASANPPSASREPVHLQGGAPGSLPPNPVASAPKRELPPIGRDVVDVWPALLGTYFGGMVLAFFISFEHGDYTGLLIGGLGRLLVIAAFIAFFSFLRMLSQPSGAGALQQRLLVMMAAAQIVTCAGGELLMRYLGLPFAINGPWIILAVAIVMSALLSYSAEPPAARG
jgi:preprotein translocase subunit SecY